MPSTSTVSPGGRTPPSGLGEFLQGRRLRADPLRTEIVPDGRRRRVSGLRREELADLAGISTDYYTRLEQGRERHPSTQVLGALARALHLDDDESGHLFLLAGRAAPPPSVPAPGVGPDLRALLDPSLLRTPVSVLGPALDIVELNAAGRALYSGFAEKKNLLHMIFLDPAAQDFYEDWTFTASATVASLRATSAHLAGDPRAEVVIEDLCARSSLFAELWSSHDIRLDPCPATHLMRHPVVGDLHLYCTTLAVVSVPGTQLHIFTPEPGSETAERVERLAATG